ncbi:MAG: DUF2520 domain-containing protein [Syntrophomonadaceae bacterium]|nr:DUF2520 domain-containing protein [Syntrophomonadaceae bacterium]
MTVKIGIIGSGKVGSAIGVILNRQGYELAGVYDVVCESTTQLVDQTGCRAFRDPGQLSRAADILFITSTDGAIGQVAEHLADSSSFRNGQTVIHMSGAHSAEILGMARKFGARVLSLHPLQSFASLEGAIESLPGSVFSIEGDKEAHETGTQLVEAMGGLYFFITADAKPLYHAGACVVSNYLVALIDLGARLLEATGISADLSSQALMPLVRGTLSNIEKVGIPVALTGPIARGDVATVARHLERMQEKVPEMVHLYKTLGLYTVPIAAAKGNINEDKMRKLQELFEPETDINNRTQRNDGGG